MSTGLIIVMLIIGFLALATICGMIENCVRIVTQQNTERYRIYENSIKNENFETAQSEDEKEE